MKKIISALILVGMLTASFVAAESGEDYNTGYREGYDKGYEEGSNTVYRPRVPKISIINKDYVEAKAGEYVNIKVDYLNESENTASKIKISPIFDGSIFEYERPVTYEAEKSVRPNRDGCATFSLKVKPNVKIGIYELKFNMEYQNYNDENYSSTGSVFVKVISEKNKSRITIDGIQTEPEEIHEGDSFTLKFNIHNMGDLDATEMNVKLSNLSEDNFMARDAQDSIYIGTLKAHSTHTVTFMMIASKKIEKGNHSLGVKVSYQDSDGEDASEEKTIYILDVQNNSKEDIEPEKSKTNKPKIMVESYTTNPNAIVAGDKIHFTFTFRNTNKENTISNMKITISSDGAFMIAHGSNTFYVEELAPRASLTKSIDLNVKQDLTSNSYPVKISFDYEDKEGNSYTADEVINLPVTEFSKLVINNANVYDCTVNQPASLSFDYINMGKAKISNMTASVEGDFTAVQTINYIGNLEAGNSDYYDIQVIPTKEGKINGTLILSFEDSSGKVIEERKAFSANAMGEFEVGLIDEPTPWNEPIEEEKTYFNWWQFVLFGFLGFCISFLITKWITKKIIQKKLDDEI